MTSLSRNLVVAVLLSLCSIAAAPAAASITRISGPLGIFGESRLFVKFDVAFDSVNNVYLVVWGTQQHGPVNGMFLDRNGTPISAVFPVSEGPQQSGWARVAYSPQQNRFLVAYTKIVTGTVHQRTARFVQWAGGPSLPWPEIPVAAWGGAAGSDAGVVYSPGAGRFFMTWWSPGPAYPVSWFASVDPGSNTASPPVLISDPVDAQSDPEISCDPGSNRCLIVGWSWGLTNGNLNTVWGRLIEAHSGNPVGAPFIISGSPLESEPTVGFSAGHFVVAFVRNFSSVWTVPVSPGGGVGAPRPIAVSAGEATIDGGGYGTISIAGNSGTGTLLVSMLTWSSYAAVQEVDAAGGKIPGSFDIVPHASGDFNRRSKETATTADPGAGRFIVLDNDQFLAGRQSLYSTTGAQPPPPPPPAPTVSRPLMQIDYPANGSTIRSDFGIAGWALDLGSTSGTGVSLVHAWAFPTNGATPIFIGAGAVNQQRPDVGNHVGNAQFAASGFGMSAFLPPGEYDIRVSMLSTVAGGFNHALVTRVRVIALEAKPRMSVDTPHQHQVVGQTFWISGWAVDLASSDGPGVTTTHAWAYPISGAPPIFVGVGTMGVFRPDVGAFYQDSRFAWSGYFLQGSLPPGGYHLVVYAWSTFTGGFNQSVLVPLTVQ